MCVSRFHDFIDKKWWFQSLAWSGSLVDDQEWKLFDHVCLGWLTCINLPSLYWLTCGSCKLWCPVILNSMNYFGCCLVVEFCPYFLSLGGICHSIFCVNFSIKLRSSNLKVMFILCTLMWYVIVLPNNLTMTSCIRLGGKILCFVWNVYLKCFIVLCISSAAVYMLYCSVRTTISIICVVSLIRVLAMYALMCWFMTLSRSDLGFVSQFMKALWMMFNMMVNPIFWLCSRFSWSRDILSSHALGFYF